LVEQGGSQSNFDPTIPAAMKADKRIMDAITTSPTKQNAKISSDNKVKINASIFGVLQTENFQEIHHRFRFPETLQRVFFLLVFGKQNQPT
jgi:hypothetical protein